MAVIPSDFDVVPIRARYVSFDNVPLVGTVTFRPSIPDLVSRSTGVGIIARPIVGKVINGVLFAEDGTSELVLFATNDEDVTRQGWVYSVEEKLNGNAGRKAFNISVPVEAKITGLDLWSVAPAVPSPSPSASYVLAPAFASLEGRVLTLETSGVPSDGGTVDTSAFVTDDELAAALAEVTPASIGAQPAGSYTTEQDVAAALAADLADVVRDGDSRLTNARTPLAHTHTSSSITDLAESVQDVVGGMVKAGSNVTAAYDDAAGTLTLSATSSGGGTVTADGETIRDTIAAALVAGTGVQVLVDDAADTITVRVSGLTISDVSGLQAVLAAKVDTDDLSAVALTGSYADLVDVPASGGAPVAPRLAVGATRGNHLAPLSNFLSTSGHMGATYRTRHRAETDLVDPVLVYGNLRRNNNRYEAGPNAITVRASIEVPGTAEPVPLWADAGQRDLALAAGATGVVRGPGVTIPAGSLFYVRTYVSVASSGQQWPVGMTTYPADGEGNNSSATPTDLTGGGTVPTAFAFGFSPMALLGRRPGALEPVAVGLVGDSIITGQGDQPNDNGWAVRALAAAGLPWVRTSVPGEKASDLAAAPALRRPPLRYADVIVTHHGRNDLTGGATLAAVQASLVACWRELAATGRPVVQGTITPQSSSNDSFATTSGQTTASSNAARVALNGWLRAGAPLDAAGAPVAAGAGGAYLAGSVGHPLSAVLEVADAVESARDSGLWKASFTTDGLHPLPAGHQAIAAAVDVAALAALVPAARPPFVRLPQAEYESLPAFDKADPDVLYLTS